MELTLLKAHAGTLADFAWRNARGQPLQPEEYEAFAVTLQGFMDELLGALQSLQPAAAALPDPPTAP